MCDDVLTLGRGQQHRVARASSLEGARLLKKLTLEERLAPAAHLVQRPACQHRGMVNVRRYPGGSFPYSGDGEDNFGRGVTFWSFFHHAALPYTSCVAGYSTRSRSDYCSSTCSTRIPVAAAVLEERGDAALLVRVSAVLLYVSIELSWFPACACKSLDLGVKLFFHSTGTDLQVSHAPRREGAYPFIQRASKQAHSAALQSVRLACLLSWYCLLDHWSTAVGDEKQVLLS